MLCAIYYLFGALSVDVEKESSPVRTYIFSQNKSEYIIHETIMQVLWQPINMCLRLLIFSITLNHMLYRFTEELNKINEVLQFILSFKLSILSSC